MTKEQAEEVLAKSKGPVSVIAQGTDGTFYVLSNEEAKRATIPKKFTKHITSLIPKQQPQGTVERDVHTRICDAYGDWLLGHFPSSIKNTKEVAEWEGIYSAWEDEGCG
jgi:hypothetical protein